MLNPSKITSTYRANLILLTYQNLLKKSDRILDLGCGTGVVSFFLSNRLKLKITCCDVKNYLIHSLPFVLINENGKLPFKNKSFDVVMLNDVLHHIEGPQQYKILKEALRVAKKVVIFEVKPTLSGKIFDIIMNKIHYGDLKAPLTFKDEAGWAKVFEKLNAKYEAFNIEAGFLYPFSHIAFSITQKPKSAKAT